MVVKQVWKLSTEDVDLNSQLKSETWNRIFDLYLLLWKAPQPQFKMKGFFQTPQILSLREEIYLNITKYNTFSLQWSKPIQTQTELLKVKDSLTMSLCYGQDMFTHLFLLIARSNPLIWTNHSTEIMTIWINIGFA